MNVNNQAGAKKKSNVEVFGYIYSSLVLLVTVLITLAYYQPPLLKIPSDFLNVFKAQPAPSLQPAALENIAEHNSHPGKQKRH